MENQVLLKQLYQPRETVLLDVGSGQYRVITEGESAIVRGNFGVILGNTLAVYAEAPTLYFQWNDRRWDLAAANLKMSYGHDFSRKVTIFSVDGESFEYPAWWRDDPQFNPHLPERDEDEDYLGYVFSLAKNRMLQQSLLKAWG